MNTQPKSIMWGAVIFIAVIAGLWGVWRLTTAPAGTSEQANIAVEVDETDHVKGSENGPVTLVEYSDLQCPACRAFAPLVRQLVDANADTLRFVYRHFPLQQHQYAQDAAYAAEAAGNQGKFFEYHDILFDRQDDWATGKDLEETFVAYAEELELDVEQFTTDMSSDEVRNKVESDLSSGITAGVNSTPSFYLNGVPVRNPNSIEAFQTLIDAELAKVPETEAMEEHDATDEAEPTETSDEPKPTE